jgi:hypothetical protein
MKLMPANFIAGEIFARWPVRFCRVTAAVAGNCGLTLKNMPVFQVFYGCAGFVFGVARPLLNNPCESN